MSVSPSPSQGAPSLAEVLIERTFAKPTNPFVDGDVIDALVEHAAESPPVTLAVSSAQAAPPDQPAAPAALAPVPSPEPARAIDVRA